MYGGLRERPVFGAACDLRVCRLCELPVKPNLRPRPFALGKERDFPAPEGRNTGVSVACASIFTRYLVVEWFCFLFSWLEPCLAMCA